MINLADHLVFQHIYRNKRLISTAFISGYSSSKTQAFLFDLKYKFDCDENCYQFLNDCYCCQIA